MTKQYLLTILLTLFASTLWAFQVGNLHYNILDAEAQTAEVIQNDSYRTNLTAVDVPATVDYDGHTFAVTAIGDWAFSQCSLLTSVTLPETLTTIGQEAFTDCTALPAILLPAPVTSIGDWAFANCNHLTSVTSLSLTPPTVGQDAFSGLGAEPVLYVWDNVLETYRTTGWSNFFGDKIRPITVCEGNIYYRLDREAQTAVVIRDDSYRSLTEATIAASVDYLDATYTVVTIEAAAFTECIQLTTIALPETLTTIGETAFAYCSALSTITIPEGITTIANSLFQHCASLRTITLPAGLTRIGEWAFLGCSSLQHITLPAGLTTIGTRAFESCSSLQRLTIPASVTAIGEYAFAYCPGLTELSVAEDNPIYDNREDCNAIVLTATNTLLVGCATTTIHSSITAIGEWAFYGCSSLTEIALPEGNLTSIGMGAFSDCEALMGLTLPASVTTIGERAFAGCYALTALSVAEANPVYDSREDCNAIVETATNTLIAACATTAIPTSVTVIGTYAFSSHRTMTTLTLPANITHIKGGAFYYCSQLRTVVSLATTPPTLENQAFPLHAFQGVLYVWSDAVDAYKTSGWNTYFYSGIQAIPDTCTDGTLYYRLLDREAQTAEVIYDASYKDFTTVDVPATVDYLHLTFSVTGVGEYAFSQCGSLTTVTLPESVTEIRKGAFAECHALQTIHLPSALTTIRPELFLDCTALTAIDLPATITTIGNWAFVGCTGLTEIALPESVTEIGTSAFAGCRSLTELTFPAAVTTIGDHAFYGSGLQTVISLSTTPPALSTETFGNIPAEALLYVRHTAVADYRASAWQPFFADILPIDDKPTALEDAYNEGSSAAPRKILRDGNVLILRGSDIYDTAGRRVE